MSWWVVVNPSAGRKGDLAGRVRAALGARSIDFEARVSASAAEVADIVDEGVTAGARRFVAVGGDGTAHMVLNALMAHEWGAPPVLGILPAGSGSDFIRTFALPKQLEAAADHFVSDDVYRCDVGVLEGSFGTRYFLNVADIGVAAAAVRTSNRLPRSIGGTRYSLAFWMTLARFPAAEIHLETAKRSYEGSAINVVVANGQFFGGGLNIAPKATLVDGLLDIQVFTGPRRQAFSVMPRVIRGLHLNHKGVRRFSVPSFTLHVDDDWPIEADGELLGAGSVTGRALPGVLDFKI